MCESMLNGIISLLISIFVIPWVLKRQKQKKQRFMIALALGDVIRHIDELIKNSEYYQNKNKDNISIQTKDKNKPTYIGYVAMFNHEKFYLTEVINISSTILKQELRIVEGVPKCLTESKRFEVLYSLLLNISSNYSELINDNILKQIAQTAFSITNLRNGTETWVKRIENNSDEGIYFNDKYYLYKIKSVYVEMIKLQNKLMNCDKYFELHRNTDRS